MHRSLAYFWQINLAVLLGVAIATAVLTGALIVGDSVRESLRHLVLHRLGGIDYALTSNRFFRQELAVDLSNEPSNNGSTELLPPFFYEEPPSPKTQNLEPQKLIFTESIISSSNCGNMESPLILHKMMLVQRT